MVDFSNCTISKRHVGGVSPKTVVTFNGVDFMLKFPKVKHSVVRNDHITEYIASSIARLLGYNTQEVLLGLYQEVEVVACKLFDYDLITFAGFGDSTLSYQELDYDLDRLLDIPFNLSKFDMSSNEFVEYVWSVFCLDMLLCNFDRHENNWGFRQTANGYRPAGLFDMGASLFPKLIPTCGSITLPELQHLLEFDTRCAIKLNGKKKTYTELFSSHRNPVLMSQMQELLGKCRLLDISPILQDVVSFSSKYTTYCLFVRTLFNKQVERLGILCKGC